MASDVDDLESWGDHMTTLLENKSFLRSLTRFDSAERIRTVARSMSLSAKPLECKRVTGDCDSSVPWGVGLTYGREYYDRIGGGIAKVAECPNGFVIKGVGVQRCGNGFTSLQLAFNCCRMRISFE